MKVVRIGEVWRKRYSTNSPRKEKLQATSASTIGFLPRSLRNLPTQTRLIVGLTFLAWGSLGIYLIEPVEKKLGLEARSMTTTSYNMKENREESPNFPRIEVIERKKD
ncbi:hypothetical protein OnM2_009024 [Erysiphe neolycopersici]|uniref:Uncharacterized protein n=1 Tax=Erysiphe neolycopersici TaxID=212602 RepID=A0A420I6S8_9PEZI|nr:hypothetical protein OnM2_009024 [Erysiphe neolycopersici]